MMVVVMAWMMMMVVVGMMVVVLMIGRKYIACPPLRPAESEQSLLEGGPSQGKGEKEGGYLVGYGLGNLWMCKFWIGFESNFYHHLEVTRSEKADRCFVNIHSKAKFNVLNNYKVLFPANMNIFQNLFWMECDFILDPWQRKKL